MPGPVCASVDMGTNTILMLIGQKDDDGKLNIISDNHGIARLGENLSNTGSISPSAILRASDILKQYNEICRKNGVDKIRVCATSAMREAKNSDQVRKHLSDIIEADIEIISGDEEARLSYIGAVGFGSDAALLDIGGGSTELILGENGDIKYRRSLKIGSVKLTEQFFTDQPPSAGELVNAELFIRNQIQSFGQVDTPEKLFAVAGTPTTIASVALRLKEFDHVRIQGYRLTMKEIEKAMQIFMMKSREDLTSEFGIHPNRADLITAGAVILKESMNYLKSDFVIVSTFGLRYGILKDMLSLK